MPMYQLIIILYGPLTLGARVGASKTYNQSGGTDFLGQIQSSEKKYSKVFDQFAMAASGLGLLVGYVVKSYLDYRHQQWLWRFNRLSHQLEHFYGPLAATALESKAALDTTLYLYAVDANKNPNDVTLFKCLLEEVAAAEQAGRLNSRGAETWVLFIKSIAININSRQVEVLRSYSHLHDGLYPDSFHRMVAHTKEMEMIVHRWEHGDYTILRGKVHEYPVEFNDEVRRHAEHCKAEMARMQGVPVQEDDDEDEDGARHSRTLISFPRVREDMRAQYEPLAQE